MTDAQTPQLPYHIPALLSQTVEALDVHPAGVYVDCTLGGGGHSRALLELLDPEAGGRLLGFDQDREAIDRALADPELCRFPATLSLADPEGTRGGFTPVWGNFRFLRNFLRFNCCGEVDGILADLGVSFHHFDDPERGFSFRWRGALDMRMNRRGQKSAADRINEADEERLAEIFHLYGELRQSRRIARALVEARRRRPVTTVEQLLEVVGPLINPRQEKKELAQLFQALRIVVNNEIEALQQLLQQSLEVLRPGGRLAIITYHSLEDRLVKNFMRSGNIEGRVEQDFFGKALAPLKPIFSKPIVPSAEEMERNPRSRSAKLRVAQKL